MITQFADTMSYGEATFPGLDPLFVGAAPPRPHVPSRSLFQRPELPAPTVAEVIRRFAPSVLDDFPHRFSQHQKRVLRQLIDCRQGGLGSHIYDCGQCGHYLFLYNPCHNRHCPECAKAKNNAWLKRLQSWSLPIPYLHIVFTLPHTLNPLIAANPELLRLLFRAVNEALRKLTREKFGVQIGCVMVLHTWGQQLKLHFHLHVLVTAGGLSEDNERWISFLEEDGILTPETLSPLFRDNYVRGVKQLFAQQELVIPQTLKWITSEKQLDRLLLQSQRYPWRIHVQHAPEHCDGPDAALKYLAQYASGTAIQDLRIVSATDTHVTIQYKDYRRNREVRRLTLSNTTFIGRFAQHILPQGLTRVRYTGLFHGPHRQEKLAACYAALKRQFPARCAPRPPSGIPGFGEYHGPSCPCCGAEGMKFQGRYNFEEAAEIMERYARYRQRITSTFDTLSLPRVLTKTLDALLASVQPFVDVDLQATWTGTTCVGFMLPEPEP